MAGENFEYDLSKRFLSLLGDLTDNETIILGSYVTTEPMYKEIHAEILKVKYPTLASNEIEIEKYNIRQSYNHHLALLGVLEPIYKIDSTVELDKLKSSLTISGYMATITGKNFFMYIQNNKF